MFGAQHPFGSTFAKIFDPLVIPLSGLTWQASNPKKKKKARGREGMFLLGFCCISFKQGEGEIHFTLHLEVMDLPTPMFG